MPVTAYLVINFNIETGLQNEENINKISTSKVTIDLNQVAYEIKVKESDEQEDTILETQDINKKVNYKLLIIGGFLFMISILYLTYQIWKYQISELEKTEVKVRKILKKYNQIIVKLESVPKFDNTNIIDVKSFEDLIEIEEEIREPIMYYKEQ